MSKTRIILMGTSEFAVPSFENILRDENFEVLSLYAQPDKKIGRKQVITQSPTKKTALKINSNLTIHQPHSFKNEQVINKFKSLKADIAFIISYGHILPETILNSPKFGCVNLHASLLPNLRGSSPINGAILNGFNKTGITYFKLEKGIDDGDIIWQEEIPLNGNETTKSLHDYLAEFGARTCINVLNKYINGDLILKKQNHKNANFCNKLSREDGELHWGMFDADYLEKQIRAYNSWPGTYTHFKKKRLKIFDSELSEERPHKLPGTVFRTTDNKIAIRAKNKSLILKNVQLEGKAKCNIESLINGYSDFINSILE